MCVPRVSCQRIKLMVTQAAQWITNMYQHQRVGRVDLAELEAITQRAVEGGTNPGQAQKMPRTSGPKVTNRPL